MTLRHALARAACVLALLCASGCPRPCSTDEDCNEGDVCAVADGKGTCVAAGSVPPRVVDSGTPLVDDAGDPEPEDGGVPDDAGEPVDGGESVDGGAGDDDAGIVDAGNGQSMTLRGGIEVGPGVLRGGTKTLKGRILSPGAGTARGGTLKLEAQGGGAPP